MWLGIFQNSLQMDYSVVTKTGNYHCWENDHRTNRKIVEPPDVRQNHQMCDRTSCKHAERATATSKYTAQRCQRTLHRRNFKLTMHLTQPTTWDVRLFKNGFQRKQPYSNHMDSETNFIAEKCISQTSFIDVISMLILKQIELKTCHSFDLSVPHQPPMQFLSDKVFPFSSPFSSKICWLSFYTFSADDALIRNLRKANQNNERVLLRHFIDFSDVTFQVTSEKINEMPQLRCVCPSVDVSQVPY